MNKAPTDAERVLFLERDNENLLQEITTLRAQIGALRARNRVLEEALEARTVYVSSSGGGGGARTNAVGLHLKQDSDRGSQAGTTRSPASTRRLVTEDTTSSSARMLAPTEITTPPQSTTSTPAAPPAVVFRLPNARNATLPDIAQALAAMNLVNPTRLGTPEAVTSFMSQITSKWHKPQKNFRTAFDKAFGYLKQQAPGLPTEWSLGVVRCLKEMEPDAEPQLCWVLLLALSIAVVGDVAAQALQKLPLFVKLEVVAVMPPASPVAPVIDFITEVVEETMQEIWEGKRKILSLQHGWVE